MTNTGMDVTVVIPVLNGARTIATVLAALQAQSIGRDFPILIVDNGSADETREIVQGSRARVVEEPVRGPSAARNRGLREAHTELVAFVDADTVPTRRWLAELLGAFVDPQTLLACGETESLPPRTPAQRFAAHYRVHQSQAREDGPLAFSSSGNICVRRTAALAIGGFDQAMLTCEDVDFCFRMRRRYGAPIAYRGAALALHDDRETDEELKQQAQGYGAGRVHLVQRYPDVLTWGLRDKLQVVWLLTIRTALEAQARLLRPFGRASDEDVLLRSYARRWAIWFWGSFLRERRRIGRWL